MWMWILGIDTRGGHCQRFVTSLVVLLRPTESISYEWKYCEMGPTVFRPYPRRLVISLTICRCQSKAALSPQLFKDPECWSGTQPIELTRWRTISYCKKKQRPILSILGFKCGPLTSKARDGPILIYLFIYLFIYLIHHAIQIWGKDERKKGNCCGIKEA